jgi:hypothetical protein
MKTILSLIATLIFISCQHNESYHSPQKPKLILYKEASNLKGLGGFKIGETTIDTIKYLNDVIKNDRRYHSYSNAFILNKDFSDCSIIKVFEIIEFYISDVKLDDMKLYFYDNVLYEIDCNPSENIKTAFTQKYGEGVKFTYKNGCGPNDKICETLEDISWENDSIQANYYIKLVEKRNKPNLIEHFTIKTKTHTLRDVNDCIKNSYDKRKSEEHNLKNKSLQKL